MNCRGNIPERSAERYIKELREGRSLERKKYKARTKTAQTSRNVRKVIEKVKKKDKVHLLRQVGRTTGMSHMSVKRIFTSTDA